jgi:hypothetical protein
MLPRGSAPLIGMRKAGQVPDGQVWVSYGDFRDPDWHRWANTMHSPELIVRPSDPVDRLDLRCVVKLPVTLFASSYDDNAALLFHRLQDYASEIVFLSPDFEDDLGMWWLPKYGVIEYGQRHIVTAYEAARDGCMSSACRRNDGEYKKFQANEMRLLKENSWLRC